MKKICLFCQSEGPFNKEHVFGNWSNQEGVLPALVNGYRFQTHSKWLSPSDLKRTEPKLLELRQGSIGHFTTTLVCSDCNGGWMSKIEERASIILKSLYKDKNLQVSENLCTSLLHWGAKCLIILDKKAPVSAITQFEREDLKQGFISENFKIYIGRYSCDIKDLAFAHLESSLYIPSDIIELNPEKLQKTRNTLFFSYLRGHFFMHIFYSNSIYRDKLIQEIEMPKTLKELSAATHLEWYDFPKMTIQEVEDAHFTHIKEASLLLGSKTLI